MKAPNADAEFAAVSQWNAAHPVGTKVTVTKDDGTKTETATNSVAWVIGGHTAVVGLEGISGGYRLSRVKPTGN